MTSVHILLIFLQCCCVSGQPLLGYYFKPMADVALRVSVDEVNRQSSNFNLYRATNRVVRQISQVGDNVYDILLDSGIKDTVCLKYHRRTYVDGCIFKWSPFMSMEQCSSLVPVGSGLAAPLGISCVAAPNALGSSSESSSGSSSEESIVQAQNKPNRALFSLGLILCQGALDCSRLLL
ncbi:LOW QUALITY PROTEIN: uncharacterized protein LOC127655162 [Xyrauchen texanus]|uniref:LOW QUALITY PROTEIN: uncharacterized protein LOC127655162 n=1 Tax=Xyrauchen texanus TaxID=154827 RepID=UPI002242499C|nr:LOW QUALITY PROTEIN: uncharacterized protein LOC127655162 [Xyrauchen texanus]